MKIYVENFNGILDGTIALLESRGMLIDNYHFADAFLLWQDVRGDMRDIARIAKEDLRKPVFVMQHGRGATRDYCPPSGFPLLADKIFVWGETEKLRLLKVGIPEQRISVVGCPLLKRLKPKNKREGKNIVFAPIISSKEEPENILVYAELKKWECDKLIQSVNEKFPKLKKGWATENNLIKEYISPDGKKEDRLWKKEVIPKVYRSILYDKGLLNVKITGVHDQAHYMSPLIGTNPGEAVHVDVVVELLQNTDVLVCLEEGTMQLLACALDIPVVVADVFKYGEYGGVKDYDRIEKISTNAVYRTSKYYKIPCLVDQALSRPDELRKNRIRVCEEEGGAHLGNPDENIVGEIERYCREAIAA